MDLSHEEIQRREFQSILFELSKSQEVLRDKANRAKIYKRLEDLYYAPQKESVFRHFYSDIFSVLTMVQQGDKAGSIDILGDNLAKIRKGYRPLNYDDRGNLVDISESLKKLYDHVSLDIARINYSDAADRKLSQEASISEIKASVTRESTQLSQLSEKIEDLRKNVDHAQNAEKEYIAILGIFAAVVLAFTGGIAFTTSVFQNLHMSSVYRVVLVALIIGLVLSNILYGLFYYIDRLVNGVGKDERKIKPLWITNVVLLLLIGATVLGWYTGVAEWRNTRIGDSIVETESITEPFSTDLTDKGENG